MSGGGCYWRRRRAKRRTHSETENAENKPFQKIKYESEIEDRISELPDCILLHILSFVNAKYAVQTCILSTRWKDLWKSLPILILHLNDFSTVPRFTKFVSRILTLRDDSTPLQGLDFKRVSPVQTRFLKRIVKYAVSRNVQQLGLNVKCDIERFPHCIFSCETLTSLKLAVQSECSHSERMSFPKSLNLPALTALHLENFAFPAANDNYFCAAEPFSAFIKLNSLIIHNCSLTNGNSILCISSTTLCHLTVFDNSRHLSYKIELSSPRLRTFAFEGTPSQFLYGDNLSSVEQVNIHVPIWSIEQEKDELLDRRNYPRPSLILLTWLVKLSNIKSLTVTESTLQVLLLYPDLLKVTIPILKSLKSLRIKQEQFSYGFHTTLRAEHIPDRIVDFLLRQSPSAKVDIIRCST